MKNSRIAIVVAALFAGATVRAAEFNLTTADWDWLYSAQPVINSLMPWNEKDRTALVTFRTHPDAGYDVLEQYFQIRDVRDKLPATLTATIVKPLGKSLREQLISLHLNTPGASPEELAGQLSVFRAVVSERTCPELRLRMKQLAKVAVRTPSFNTLAVHPLVRAIDIRSGMGNVYAELYDDDDPMVKWASVTFESLDRCAQSSTTGHER